MDVEWDDTAAAPSTRRKRKLDTQTRTSSRDHQQLPKKRKCAEPECTSSTKACTAKGKKVHAPKTTQITTKKTLETIAMDPLAKKVRASSLSSQPPLDDPPVEDGEILLGEDFAGIGSAQTSLGNSGIKHKLAW